MRNFILVVLAVVAFAGVTAAQQPTMEEICKKWDARRAAIKCVKYEFVEETSIQTRPATIQGDQKQRIALGVSPPAEYKLTTKHHLAIEVATGKFRHETDGQEWDYKRGRIVPLRGITTFDGIKVRSMKLPNAGQSDVGKQFGLASDFAEITGDFRSQEFKEHLLPVFYDLGIVPLLIGDLLFPGQFHQYHPSQFADTVKLSVDASKPGSLIGTLVPLLRRRSAVAGQIAVGSTHGEVRSFTTTVGMVTCKTVTTYGKADGGWPLLTGWAMTTDSKDEFSIRTTIRNVLIDQRVTLSTQDVEITPQAGMIFMKLHQNKDDTAERKNPEMKRFSVQENGELLEYPEPRPVRLPLAWGYGAMAGGCIVLLLGGYLLRRWKTTRRKKATAE